MVDVSALSRQRVKVYQLSDDGQWDDKGTGHIYYQMDEQVFSFSVRSEENNSVLLEHKIEATIDYQRQGDSIIMWSEPDGHDTALSFLDFYACNSLWEHITSAQTGKNDDLLSRANDENSPPTEEAANDATRGPLPPPDINNLETIFSKITAANKDHIIRAIQQNYIQQLLDVFTEIEDGEQKELLSIMFYIFNAIIALNEMPIIEILFSEENFFRILGPLEYDPDLPATATHRQHREFLKNAVFKQVVTIKDPTVLNKIHQNYRYTYIKDVVLLRYLDDPTLSTMNSLIYYNNLAIMTYIAETPEVLSELFAKLKAFAPYTMQRPQGKDAKPAAATQAEYETQRKEVWNFVKEIFLIAKTMELKFKASFFRALVNQGLLRLMETALASASADQQTWLWIACTEAVSTITCHHDPELIRTHFLNRTGPESLLGLLVQTAVSDSMSSGIAHQLVEVLKILLDVETMQASLKDKFMDIFYSQHIGTIVKALTRPLLPVHFEPTAISTPKFHAVELLTHCIVKHGYRCKHYVTRHNVLSKVADLVTTGGRELALSCIRCIRATIGLKDEQFSRHIAQQQLLDPIIALFLKNGARYNMVNSAVIELCEFIIRDPQKDLLESLLTRHWAKLEHISYVDTFKRLKERFDELEKGAHASDADSDTPSTSPRPGSNGVSPAADRWRATRKDDAAEDSYFNETADDDHEHSAAASAGEGGEASRPAPALSSPTAAGGSSPVSPTAAGASSPTSPRIGKARSPRSTSPPLSVSPGSPPAVFSKSPLSPPPVSLSSPTSPRNKDRSPLSPPGRVASSSPPTARPTGGSSPKSVEGLTLDSDGFLDRRELESKKDQSEPDFMSALSQKNAGKGAGASSAPTASAVLAGTNKNKTRLPIKVQTKPQKLSVNLTAALSKQLSPNSPASPSSPHSPSPSSSPVSTGTGIKLVDYDDDEEEEEAGDKKTGSAVAASLVSPPSLSHAKSKVGEMPSSDPSPAHNSGGGRESDAESPQTPTKKRKTGAAPEENGSGAASSPISAPVSASPANQ